MPGETTYGYKTLSDGDTAKGDLGWFTSINFDINRLDQHNHDGVNSKSLSLSTFSPYSQTIVGPQTFLYADVNDTNDTISISSHGLVQSQMNSTTGIPVVLTLVDTITNLANGTTYYVVVMDDGNTIQLSDSIANAQNCSTVVANAAANVSSGYAIDMTKTVDGGTDNTLNPWVVVTASTQWKQTITVPAGVSDIEDYNVKFFATAPAGIASEIVYLNYKKITTSTYEVYINDNTAAFTAYYR